MACSSPAARWILLLALLLCVATPSAREAQETGMLQEMEVLGVTADGRGQAQILLRSKLDKRGLSMAIDPFAAVGIALPLEGVTPPRPYTHDLILDLFRHFHVTLTRAVITQLKDNTYYATLVLDVDGREVLVDSRPSDAVALALRVNAPILAAEGLLNAQPSETQQ